MTVQGSAPRDLVDDGVPVDASGWRRPPTQASRSLPSVAAVLCAVTATRWIDVVAPAVIVVPQAVVPWVVPAAVLLLAGALPARRWATAAASIVLLLVHAVLLVPWWLPGTADTPAAATTPVAAAAGGAAAPAGVVRAPAARAAGGSALTVLSSNLQYGRGDAATVVAEVVGREVDVLVLLEVTSRAQRALAQAGLDAVLPHHVGVPREDAGGAMIYSRHPLDNPGLPRVPRLAFDAPVARVRAPGGDVLVLAAHPVPPWPGDTARWHVEVTALADWLTRSALGDVPTIVAGDLNGSTDHPVIRRFLRAGMVDAHEAAGAGRPRTWPHAIALPLPAMAQLDHVLTHGLRPVAAGSVRVPGSDHDAVWARVHRSSG